MGCQTITPDAVVTINAPLLRQVLAHIEANPETWDQSTWRCETGMCFAGWTAELAGGTWLTLPMRMFSTYLAAEPGDDAGTREVDGLGRGIPVEIRAQRLLGLSYAQAERLFFGSNTLDDIRLLVGEYIALVPHVTVRVVPFDELVIGEVLPDGRSPLEVIEHRPGLEPMLHGTERGMPAHQLRAHARAVADRLGMSFIDPIDPAAMERLARAEAA